VLSIFRTLHTCVIVKYMSNDLPLPYASSGAGWSTRPCNACKCLCLSCFSNSFSGHVVDLRQAATSYNT
jgi:hypothetical protein